MSKLFQIRYGLLGFVSILASSPVSAIVEPVSIPHVAVVEPHAAVEPVMRLPAGDAVQEAGSVRTSAMISHPVAGHVATVASDATSRPERVTIAYALFFVLLAAAFVCIAAKIKVQR